MSQVEKMVPRDGLEFSQEKIVSFHILLNVVLLSAEGNYSQSFSKLFSEGGVCALVTLGRLFWPRNYFFSGFQFQLRQHFPLDFTVLGTLFVKDYFLVVFCPG